MPANSTYFRGQQSRPPIPRRTKAKGSGGRHQYREFFWLPHSSIVFNRKILTGRTQRDLHAGGAGILGAALPVVFTVNLKAIIRSAITRIHDPIESKSAKRRSDNLTVAVGLQAVAIRTLDASIKGSIANRPPDHRAADRSFVTAELRLSAPEHHRFAVVRYLFDLYLVFI